VARPLSPSVLFRSICLPALLALAASLGCVDHNPTGTTLYVYDNQTSSVQIWADVNKVHDAVQNKTAMPAADRTIQSSLLNNFDLAWGGLAVDPNRQMLYLVSESGVVFAITKANTQNGSVINGADIFSYNLGSSSDGFPTSVFGQACVDINNNVLYVMQTATNGSATRVWKVTSPNLFTTTYNSPLPAASYTIGISTDTYGTGVAVAQNGTVYGLFGGGSTIYDTFQDAFSGPRLRQGPGGNFPSSIPVGTNLLMGPLTELSGAVNGTGPLTFGSLGYDTQNNQLYVFSGPTSSSIPPILVFNASQFSQGTFNLGPVRALADTAASLAAIFPPDGLRIISHPANADWLLGACYTAATGAGGPNLIIWKNPSTDGTSLVAPLPVTEIRGMAIGGTN